MDNIEDDVNEVHHCPQDKQPALIGQPTSSQSTNSEVPSNQIANALSMLNDNMSNMAEILGQVWQRVDSGGKPLVTRKRRQDEQNSSESESDERRAKNRRTAFENDDSISVAASDEDLADLLRSNTSDDRQQQDKSDQVTGSDTTDNDLLHELELQFNDDEQLGPAIGEKLANIATKRWAQKLSPEKIKQINEKYKQPQNCEAMRVSRINPEIWSQISQHKKKTDLRLSKVQQNVQKAVFAALQTAEILSAKKQQSDDIVKEREAMLRTSVDLIAMLGHVNTDLMSMRQESIKPALKPQFQKICHAAILPTSQFLFGDDLAKTVRDSKETSNIANALTLTKGKAPRQGAPNKGNKRNYNNYNRDDNTYAGENRERNTNSKPFLWKGQNQVRKRPNPNGVQNNQKQRK